MNATSSLADFRIAIDDLAHLERQASLSAATRVLRRHGLTDLSVDQLSILLDVVDGLVRTVAVDGAAPSARLTPRQLEELLADVT